MVPSFQKMMKEGPEGKKKFHQYGRIGTVLVTLIQGVIYAQGMVVQSTSGANFLAIDPFAFVIIFSATLLISFALAVFGRAAFGFAGIGANWTSLEVRSFLLKT